MADKITLGQIIDQISDNEYKQIYDKYVPRMKELKHLYKGVDFNNKKQVILAYLDDTENSTNYESKEELL